MKGKHGADCVQAHALGEGLLQACGRNTACDGSTFTNESKASWVHHKRQSRDVRLEKNLEVGGKAKATERNGVPCHVMPCPLKPLEQMREKGI